MCRQRLLLGVLAAKSKPHRIRCCGQQESHLGNDRLAHQTNKTHQKTILQPPSLHKTIDITMGQDWWVLVLAGVAGVTFARSNRSSNH
jgi:hypothetical protein